MNTEIFMEYLPFFIPLLIAEVLLALLGVIHVLRHPHYRFGNKILWICIVIIFQIVGPVLYFTIGRGDE